jgi:hypothetical protein
VHIKRKFTTSVFYNKGTPDQSYTTIELNVREFAMVIAGLRAMQLHIQAGESVGTHDGRIYAVLDKERMDWLLDIATDICQFNHLSVKEIGKLVERINR